MTEEIVGLPADESDEMLQTPFAHAENRDHVYEHTWRLGDLVMWDNRCLLHYAVHDHGDDARLLHRLQVQGESTK